LIEAKVFGAWDNEQLQSKLDGLDLLHEEYEQLHGAKLAAGNYLQVVEY
jgi:hypothetical protein